MKQEVITQLQEKERFKDRLMQQCNRLEETQLSNEMVEIYSVYDPLVMGKQEQVLLRKM